MLSLYADEAERRAMKLAGEEDWSYWTMPRYAVTVLEIHTHTMVIEAANSNDAREVASAIIDAESQAGIRRQYDIEETDAEEWAVNELSASQTSVSSDESELAESAAKRQ